MEEQRHNEAATYPPPLSEAKRQELERRVAEDDAHPEDVITWEEVKARTAGRLRGSFPFGPPLKH
jgi:putative addiction module component (TIGR02574 family)